MIKNKRLEARRKKISKDIDLFVNHSFEIVDRIQDILEAKRMEQKDLANLLGKSESEISKWMTGTHNFTLKTISKIELELGEPILQLTKEVKIERPIMVFFQNSESLVNTTAAFSSYPVALNPISQSSSQTTSNYLN